MKKLLRRAGVTAVTGLTVGAALVAGTTTPAQAAGCAGYVCGGVTNSSSSNATIPVTTNWTAAQGDYTSSQSMNYTALSPGQTKGGNFSGVDVDGFFTSTACKTYGVSGFKADGDGGRNRFTGPNGTTTGQLRNNLWIKIATDEQVTVRIVC
jgi:hypothetical protein